MFTQSFPTQQWQNEFKFIEVASKMIPMELFYKVSFINNNHEQNFKVS